MEVGLGEDLGAASSVKTLVHHKQFHVKPFISEGWERCTESLPSVCFCTDINPAPLPGNSSLWAPLKENFLLQRLCRNPRHLSYPIQHDLGAGKEFVAETPVATARFCAMQTSIPAGSLTRMGRR